jgi:undecaprenyl pyrophosphate phosphatase UppP
MSMPNFEAPDFSKIKWMYVLNVVIGVFVSAIVQALLMGNGKYQQLNDLVKIAIFLVVAGGIVALISLTVKDLAPYDDTEQQLTKFLKSKGLVAPPSFRSV